jgi:hypothetical protein
MDCCNGAEDEGARGLSVNNFLRPPNTPPAPLPALALRVEIRGVHRMQCSPFNNSQAFSDSGCWLCARCYEPRAMLTLLDLKDHWPSSES